MNGALIQAILKGDKTVREVLDEQAALTEASVDLGDEADEVADELKDDENVDEYLHLFVRRWKSDADAPYKRAKLKSAEDAIRLYFQWVDAYKSDKCEIWTDVANDAKNFYRYCIKNRETIEPLWKGSARVRRAGVNWVSAYRDIVGRARQSGSNVVGTLYPFEVDAK